MRRTLLLVAGCLLLTPAMMASPLVIKLSRPNTDYSSFLNDRNACLKDASHSEWARFPGAGSFSLTQVRYDVYAFAACMNSRGYLLDPNGFRAIRYQKDLDNKGWVEPL